MTLCADARCIDLRMACQNLPRRQHVVGAGCERKLGLVGDRRGHIACAETIQHERCKAVIRQRLGMGEMRWSDAEAARHHHDQRKFPVAPAFVRGRQEQLAVDRQSGQAGGVANDIEVVEGIG